MSFASEELQKEVWGADPDAMVCDSYAVVGQTDRVGDGYQITGKWRCGSGIEWSSWIAVGGIAVAPDGEHPEHIMFFVSKSDCLIHDDWNTMGLRGTASRAVSIDKAFVPNHRAFALGRIAGPNRSKVTEDGPLWRLPLMTMQGLAILTPSVGLSQRMVDEFTVWTKARIRPYERNPRRHAQRLPPGAHDLAGYLRRWRDPLVRGLPGRLGLAAGVAPVPAVEKAGLRRSPAHPGTHAARAEAIGPNLRYGNPNRRNPI